MSELKLQQCRLDGRYDVLECLGRGSYAEVYLARDEDAQPGAPRTVVIKALNIFLQGSIDLELERTLIENFRNEAVALDRVRHPNVINRLGHGTAIDLAGQTFHYLVLEYMPGGNLAEMCRHAPLPIESALFYLEQVCDGLAHAHSRSVIHRDIKPQNLLLTADRQTVKIADFGVAKIEAGEGGITRVGTDVYAAPEHHPLLQTGPLDPHTSSAPSRILTPAADVYSLAKTAYMLLTGEAPRRFSQKPVTEMPAHVASQPWASFVVRVLRKATETDPRKRYQTVGEFWSELSDALMPKTQLLSQVVSDETQPLSTPRGRVTMELPPEPLPARFDAEARPSRPAPSAAAERPRIVVPVKEAQKPAVPPPARELVSGEPQAARPLPRQQQAALTPQASSDGRARPARAQPEKREEPARGSFFRDHARPWIVAALLLAGFVILLLGVHYSVRTRQSAAQGTQPQRGAQQSQGQQPTGREMITTTNVNLRAGPGRSQEKIGEVESGSRVRVLRGDGGWVEIEILQRGYPRRGESGPTRGWIDGAFLR
ncbi:MAG TPA: protein kinase [Pyrinomonadaceae bacterium]|nr:protein kinase [Pyrinomonadaceae bacterium]